MYFPQTGASKSFLLSRWFMLFKAYGKYVTFRIRHLLCWPCPQTHYKPPSESTAHPSFAAIQEVVQCWLWSWFSWTQVIFTCQRGFSLTSPHRARSTRYQRRWQVSFQNVSACASLPSTEGCNKTPAFQTRDIGIIPELHYYYNTISKRLLNHMFKHNFIPYPPGYQVEWIRPSNTTHGKENPSSCKITLLVLVPADLQHCAPLCSMLRFLSGTVLTHQKSHILRKLHPQTIFHS